MKKMLALFSVIALSQAISFAYINEDTSTLIDSLDRQGFSISTQEIVDTAVMQAQGEGTNYVRRFQEIEHKNWFSKFYTRAKIYTDTAQDDGKFGMHQINFTNSWDSENTDYSSRFKKMPKQAVEEIENL